MIASLTTKDLVLRDFALEPDEKKLLRAANLTVQSLAGSLALVTCRDPLKVAFQQNLRVDLDKISDLDEAAKEDILNLTSVENLDLGCALIKKAVIEKAVDEVNRDPAVIDACEKRRAAAAKGGMYYDEKAAAIAQMLPPALQPPLYGGLTRDQLAVYEEFARVQRNQKSGKDQKGNLINGRVNSI